MIRKGCGVSQTLNFCTTLKGDVGSRNELLTLYPHMAKGNIETIMALTPLQEGMLLHYLRDTSGFRYVNVLEVKLSGTLDVNLVRNAWQALTERYGALRTVFRWEKLNNPVQIVLNQHMVFFEYRDIMATHCKEIDAYLQYNRETLQLDKVPFRVYLYKTAVQEYVMMVVNHHILYDGWSSSIILSEWIKTYDLLERNTYDHTIKGPPYQSHLEYIQNLDKKQGLLFWSKYLENAPPCMIEENVPSSSKNVIGYRSIVRSFDITMKLAVEEYCKRLNISPATFFNVAWAILLKKYSNSNDIVFGTTVSGRNTPVDDTMSMVGLLINTIPLRVRIESEQILSELMSKVQYEMAERTSYEHTSLVDIIKCASNGTDLFNTIVVFENYPVDVDTSSNLLTIEDVYSHEATSFNLSLSVSMSSVFKFEMQYSKSMYTDSFCDNLFQHLINLVKVILESGDKTIVKQLKMLTKQEENMLLSLNNCKPPPEYRDVLQIFYTAVERYFDKIAVVCNEKHLTYGELDRKSNLLAGKLRTQGIVKEDIVGLLLDSSVETVIAILAVWKAKAAYVPISKQFPERRIKEILEECTPKLLLTDNENSAYSAMLPVVNMTDYILCEEAISPPYQEYVSGENQLAYIIFTSGSTGRSNGAMIEHGAVFQLIDWFIRYFDITDKSQTMMTCCYTADFSIEDIFATLASGGTLHISDKDMLSDRNLFVEYCKKNEINILNNYSGIIRELLSDSERITSIKTVICGGDKLDIDLVKKLLALGYKVYNIYGLTETCVDIVSKECTMEDEQNVIGKARDGVSCYILDDDGHLMPFGVCGELYVSGNCLMRGYVNNPKLTSSLITQNPYTNQPMLRTGDLVRWRKNGDLIYDSRRDYQIKLRGYRISPTEIEVAISKLLDDCHVRVVIVANEGKPGQEYLCAFIQSITEIDTNNLKAKLLSILPNYMVPQRYIVVDKIPVEANGKFSDTKLVKQFIVSLPKQDIKEPSNEIQKVMLQLWKEVLGLSEIGVDDDFFDIGGNSLTIIRLYSKINAKYSGLVSVQDMFDLRTVEQIATKISEELGMDKVDAMQEKAQYIDF